MIPVSAPQAAREVNQRSWSLGKKMIVGSFDNRREPPRTSYGHCEIFVRRSRRLHDDCAVSVQSQQGLCKDCPVLSPEEIAGLS